MKKDLYQKIKETYGKNASFTYWGDCKTNDSSNLTYEKLKNRFQNKYIFVALNPSKKGILEDFQNFHRTYNDSKLAHAIIGTDYEGSYITDLYKSKHEGNSNRIKMTKRNNDIAIDELKKEINLINKEAIIIALGYRAYEILKKYEGTLKVKKIVRIYHYSYRWNGCSDMDVYKEKIKKQLKEQLGD